MNAQDIPNNPYSAEALQRRLSQTKNPSKVIDITRYHSIDESSTKPEVENGKPLQIILGAGEPDHLRLVILLSFSISAPFYSKNLSQN